MEVMNGLPFKCERCGSSKGRREKRELRGSGPFPADVAWVLRCDDCGWVVSEDAWLADNLPQTRS